VSSLASALPPLVDRVAQLDGRLTRSLSVAKQGLDILADQLVALGALNGRSSPNKNPLAGQEGAQQHLVAMCNSRASAVPVSSTGQTVYMLHLTDADSTLIV